MADGVVRASEHVSDGMRVDDLTGPDTDWVKKYKFIWWSLTIRHGSRDKFYEGKFTFLENTQVNIYSRGRYMIQFVGGSALLLMISLILVTVSVTMYGDLGLILLIAAGISAFALLFYYWLAEIPPKSFRNENDG